MVHTIHLGGDASVIEVANVGHGLMMMTWCPKPIPDEQAFQAIKEGLDAADGAKVLLNSGDFYASDLSTGNLELLARFYKRYPEYIDKTVLCVKGGLAPQSLKPMATEENIRRSIDATNAALQGTKRVDIFENARVDDTTSIEETMAIMKRLVAEGKFDHVGMSECSAATLRRANAVHPVVSVEIEVSPWSYEDETKKVIATAAELQIPVLAYSPLGRGFLTGEIRNSEDIPEGDFRKQMERFRPENFEHNLKLVQHLQNIAQKKGATAAQLCLAWLTSLGPHILPIPGSSNYTRTLENLAAGDIKLTDEEKREIDEVILSFEVKGGRYPRSAPHLWG
ncbi:aldo/keto reductase [Ramaria rubella]|nr:aldo/keto reductase [Ramaria rubella]